ncbi:hypothetical protein [uncultured Dialister sp.]|jgi:valyl-tRNA synthetase|uniref:phage scaffolding protein n=1 Tax=uncultured Dialister sp. TaxID=278064 RepID=UPI00204D4DED|nr:hypothetical protein [uncultured Dialister sp.]DAV49536.1 MAG TPA: minor structural protein [Caudoviricetes sp.]DAZ68441.1 MAG TPA: minor structural protein [Caudoviricetes sp.]
MYTLEQIFEALGKAENGGAMVADLQNLITGVRNEAAANRVEKNKVLDALGLRSSDDPQSALNNLRTALEALKKTGNPESLGSQITTLQNQVKELTDKYTASEKKVEAEHSKRINTSMQSMLQSALTKGNALNPEAFVKLLRDKVEVGEDDSMSMKVGDKSVSIDEGVKDWLAANPWAVKNMAAGGAGSGSAGTPGKVYTMDDLKGMTPDQINSHWDEIKRSMKG